jgi:hypothetical protein
LGGSGTVFLELLNIATGDIVWTQNNGSGASAPRFRGLSFDGNAYYGWANNNSFYRIHVDPSAAACYLDALWTMSGNYRDNIHDGNHIWQLRRGNTSTRGVYVYDLTGGELINSWNISNNNNAMFWDGNHFYLGG